MASEATLISNTMRRTPVSTTKLRSLNVSLVRVVVGTFITMIVLMAIGAHIKPVDCGANKKFLSGFLIALLLSMQRQQQGYYPSYYPSYQPSYAQSYPSQPNISYPQLDHFLSSYMYDD